MDLETSLYDPEMEWGNREWSQLFGGQLLTFPETPLLSSDVTTGLVLQLDHSTSGTAMLEDDWSLSGQLNHVQDQLQDSTWSQSADVGDAWEICSSRSLPNDDEKKLTDWLIDVNNMAEDDDVKAIDIYSTSVELHVSPDRSNEMLTVGIIDLQPAESLNEVGSVVLDDLILDDLSSAYEKVKSDDIIKVSIGGCIGDDEASHVVFGSMMTSSQESPSTDSKTQLSDSLQANLLIQSKQMTNIMTSSKPTISGLMRSQYQNRPSSSRVRCSGSELQDVNVDLLDGDEAIVYKLLEYLDEENIGEDIGRNGAISPVVSVIPNSTMQNEVISKSVPTNKIGANPPISSQLQSGSIAQDKKFVQAASCSTADVHISESKDFVGLPKYTSVLEDHLYPAKLPAARTCKSNGLKMSTSAVNIIRSTQKLKKYSLITESMAEFQPAVVTAENAQKEPVNSGILSTVDVAAISEDCSSDESITLGSIGSNYQGLACTSKAEPVRLVTIITQPYSTTDRLTERKERKKEQNCRAALRYRQKKREEKGHAMTEVEKLEEANEKLRNRADELSKEISYLKDLLAEVTQH